MKTYVLMLILIGIGYAFGQAPVQPKQLPSSRLSQKPKVDGNLNDPCWDGIAIATGFVEASPTPGRIEGSTRRTEVKVIYDDEAIYVAAKMYEHPDSVARELVGRDNIGTADYIGLIFDTFLDRRNGNGFFVTAAGVQFDAKYSPDAGEDPNWNAVWESAVKKDETGWTCEMRIPYSALRFSEKQLQNWGLNMIRKRALANVQSFWNFVDPKVSGLMNQEGVYTDLSNLKPPLRLSFSPYLSAYVNHFPANVPGLSNTHTAFNGGMDLKYGINNSFTLDVTLVPDFGQVKSDNRILNLTPFEVKFNENRQFFTEGTELFNKGDLFYSKRIGSIPRYFDYSGIKEGDKILKDQSEAKVLNATKISGRTAKGLGIGVFNAITQGMKTEVEDALGIISKVETQPLTNYNILVFDQSLKNNSSATFINTNVLRAGSAYDANVNGLLFNLNDKKNVYFLNGSAKMSYLRDSTSRTGFNYELKTGKQSGTFTYSYLLQFADKNFDPSDMGFFTNNNFINQTVNLSYNIFKPGNWYNQWQNWTNVAYSRRVESTDYQSLNVMLGSYVQFKNFWSVETDINYNAAAHDYYESRSAQMYKAPENFSVAVYVNPNRAKAYHLGGNFRYRAQSLFRGKEFNFYLYQNLRVNDRLGFNLNLNFNPNYNYVNWVASQRDQILFSRYDRRTVENSLNGKYSFSNKMGLSIGIRHYWSDRRNKDFYLLQSDGSLQDYAGSVPTGLDRNYNVFNVDFIYTWQFAPGSELSLSYKDAAEINDDFYTRKYNRNLDRILSTPQNNTVSLKLLYYIDYLQLKRKKS
jgi:hypothetical protein